MLLALTTLSQHNEQDRTLLSTLVLLKPLQIQLSKKGDSIRFKSQNNLAGTAYTLPDKSYFFGQQNTQHVVTCSFWNRAAAARPSLKHRDDMDSKH